MRSVFAVFFVFAGFLASGAAATSSPHVLSIQCQDLFETQPRFEDRLDGRLEELRRGIYPGVHATSGRRLMIRGHLRPEMKVHGFQKERIEFTATAKGSRAQKAGFAEVSYDADTRTLDIERTLLEEGFEKNGLTTLVVGAALKKFPNTETIVGRLILDNGALFKAAYYENMAASHREGLLAAFKATPFYKTVRIYGFTEVDLNASYFRPEAANPIDQIFIQLRRP